MDDEQHPAHVVPQVGDELHFDASSQTTTDNDLPAGTRFQSIDFSASGFILRGHDLALTDGINVAPNVTGSTISLNVALVAHNTVTVAGSSTLTISGNISGGNYLTKDGSGTLTLSGTNTYSGGTVIEDGTLSVGSDAALVQCGNGLLVNGSGAVLDLNGHNATVGQVGLVDGSITSATPATLTGSEYVVLNGTIDVDVDLYGSAAPMLKGTSGTVILSGANYYTGLTTLYAGTLQLAGPNASNPVLNGGGANVQDGKLVLDYSGNLSSDPASTVQADLDTSYAATPVFSSGKIYSSTAATTSTDVGCADSATNHQVTIARAAPGDADLDGTVNMDDLNILLNHYGLTGQIWGEGDFTYDSTVNLNDMNVLLNNYAQTVSDLPPQVLAIGRLGSTAATSSTVQFLVVFSEGVNNVDTATFSDFDLQRSDTTGTITSIDDCSPSHAVYLVTVSNVYGNGTLGLNLIDNNTITDTADQPLADAGFSGDEFVGQTYTVASPFIWVDGGSDGNWSTAANWQDGVLPIAGGSLLFEGAAPGGGTHDDFPEETSFNSIELAAAGFDFNSQYALTLTGGITLDAGVINTTISADVVLGGPVTIGVADANATLTVSGNLSGSGSLTKTGEGTLTLTGSNTYSGLTTVNDGILELGPNAQSPVLSGGGADVQGANGQVVLNYTGASDPVANVQQSLKDSYDAGAWDTGQFRCSTANGTHGLGWKDDGSANTITIARALSGDANLDGVVDLSDLSLVVANWNGAGKIWADGDFNYDGTANLADMSLLAQNWNAKLGKGDVLLSGNSTFDVDLSDDGPDMIDVTGAVRLDNATLNVTSTRSPTDDSGILRVLIRNEGGNPVIGTFNNLPEGAEVDVPGDGRYFITYHYNAETGQFGTGNDVALYSSLFSVSLTAAEHHVQDQDAQRYYEGFDQLSINLSQRDPSWTGGDPQFAYYSDTPAVATVDQTTGHVTFLQNGVCQFHVVATEPGVDDQTFEFQTPGCVDQTEYHVLDPFDASQHMLILYNATLQDSIDLTTEYKASRPGLNNANTCAITGISENDIHIATSDQCSDPNTSIVARLEPGWLRIHRSRFAISS